MAQPWSPMNVQLLCSALSSTVRSVASVVNAARTANIESSNWS